MARRRKSERGLEAVVSVLALLPWWMCVALAAVAYLLLHAYAAAPIVPPAVKPGEMHRTICPAVMQGLAGSMQYLVPLLCLIAAGVSAFKRKQRAGLVQQVGASFDVDALDGISWQDFELLVGEAFRMQGFVVKEFGGAQPDGGIDLELRRDDKTVLVQCKQWRSVKVGVAVVRELYGVMAARGAAGGYVITSGRFTPDAVAWAEARKTIKLIDGPKLHLMIQRVRAKAPVGVAGPAPRANAEVWGRTQPTAPSVPASHATWGGDTGSPSCPRCAGAMVRRTAKSGSRAGSQFWGCGQFPACRGTR